MLNSIVPTAIVRLCVIQLGQWLKLHNLGQWLKLHNLIDLLSRKVVRGRTSESITAAPRSSLSSKATTAQLLPYSW